MNSPLTLTLDKSVIEQAEQYAQSQGRSLSDLVDQYLRNLTEIQEQPSEFSPLIQSLMGSIQLDDDRDYKEILTDELIKKHLRE